MQTHTVADSLADLLPGVNGVNGVNRVNDRRRGERHGSRGVRGGVAAAHPDGGGCGTHGEGGAGVPIGIRGRVAIGIQDGNAIGIRRTDDGGEGAIARIDAEAD